MAKHVSEAIFIAIIFLKTITPQLCIPLGTTLELLPCFLFGTRWCVLSFYIYIFGGFCSYRAKKGNYM